MSLDFDTSMATARPGCAFSNGAEGDVWMARWCGECAHDVTYEIDGGCPLVLIALLGDSTPAEWVEDDPFRLGRQYTCAQYRPRGEDDTEPRPQPEPDQDGLFARPCRATRMLRQPQPQEALR